MCTYKLFSAIQFFDVIVDEIINLMYRYTRHRLVSPTLTAKITGER